MSKLFQTIRTELLWLSLSLVITFVLALLFLGWTLSNPTLDIYVHDTVFVLSTISAIIPLYILISFIVFFLKAHKGGFRKSLTNGLLLFFGLVIIICVPLLSNEIFKLALNTSGELTLYPPLSSLTSETKEPFQAEETTTILTSALTVLQLLITLILLYSTFRWGVTRGTAANI